MNDLPQDLFANPVWHALQSKHAHLAVSSGEASRYPADVAPFAAVAAPSKSALQSLHSLMTPGEQVWFIGEDHPAGDFTCDKMLECLQMVLPDDITPPAPTLDMVPLSCADAHEMVALTDLAFPGFFRIRTCEMGSYFGIRSGGELIAMGGERMILDGYSEISGVCTHPAHRGKGFATSLIWHLARKHRREGVLSWLHVSTTNQNAIKLYLRMGFIIAHTVKVHRISRSDGDVDLALSKPMRANPATE
jgi:ribosomal protein S18 acetylase RimI-like enzyme